ncbi:Alcohol dehydrogenase zinc-binding domain protein (plasmid) [Rhizobium leguminosarum bv. trifolii WSM2304]|uniref:Alcohol dehydrogenase zinc-binding domain protein n=1 Tax=Rhizobium leguminosarum bv. trifolii (strain WSM2304) TaxID=395492 RepID=A0ABF7QZC1_RHILW|nr:NADPH:quinone oxidoreductase family protein [Rhizobium leguminosarum]ACI59511.1 Alcohol dehydrogenase zinc-binding domain protein [Rhizobium leguminosarum bv. trifolii WSM2304]
MKCFAGSGLSSLEEFSFVDVPTPVPGSGQVRIRNMATALGFVDGLIIRGKYQIKPQLPYIPGGEIAGVIDAVGAGVTSTAVGSRVATWQLGGGLAEFSVVSEDDVVAIPEELDFNAAAAMIVDYQTAHYALFERGGLKEGETVLVSGAAGGVGSVAIQLARRAGARVIAAVSSEAKRERALTLGAHATVTSMGPDIRSEIKALAPLGLDMVLDPVGGSIFEPLFRSLAKEGRHMVVGFAGGSIPALSTNLALLKSASLIGVDIRHFTSAYPEAARSVLRQLFVDVRDHTLAPPAISTFEFSNCYEAFHAIGARDRIGKVVVCPNVS